MHSHGPSRSGLGRSRAACLDRARAAPHALTRSPSHTAPQSTKTYFVEVQINVFANPCAVNSHIETAETDTDSQLLFPDPSVILLLLSDPSVVLLLCYNTSTVLWP